MMGYPGGGMPQMGGPRMGAPGPGPYAPPVGAPQPQIPPNQFGALMQALGSGGNTGAMSSNPMSAAGVQMLLAALGGRMGQRGMGGGPALAGGNPEMLQQLLSPTPIQR